MGNPAVCGGISLRWNGGGWRRGDYCGRDSASPRWPERWASTASRSAAGRGSLESLECARPAPGQAHRSATQAQPGPVARARAWAQAWARGVRICQRAVDREPGARSHRVPDRGAIPRGPRLAHSAQAQLDLPASRRRALARDQEAIRQWKKVAWPRIKQKPSASGARSSSSTKAD